MRTLSGLVALYILFSYEYAIGIRDMPAENLSLPVLIESVGGSGSGLFLNDTKSVFLVTAHHVIFEGPSLRTQFLTCISYPLEGFTAGRFVLILDLRKLQETESIRNNAPMDVSIVRIGSLHENKSIWISEGVEIHEMAKGRLHSWLMENTRSFKDLLIGNDVFVFGYPKSLGLKDLPQLDFSKPLLRKGIIAGKNDIKGSMILDLPVYKGNSGGPVIEIERDAFQVHFRFVGIVSQYVPFDPRRKKSSTATQQETENDLDQADNDVATDILHNSNYAVAIPIDHVLDLISQFH